LNGKNGKMKQNKGRKGIKDEGRRNGMKGRNGGCEGDEKEGI
jgi:hypothetical protein